MRHAHLRPARVAALTFALAVSTALVAPIPTASAAAPTGGAYQPLSPARVLDTGAGTGAPKKAVAPHATLTFKVSGKGGVPASGVSAVVLNITAAATSSSGYLTAYPAGVTRPTTSSLNFTAGRTVPNLSVVKIGTGGEVSIYNGSLGTVRLIADVSGYFLAGTAVQPGTFQPLTPARVLDTGAGIGAPQHAIASHATLSVQISGQGGVPTSGAGAVALNVTVAAPTGDGYVTVYPDGVTRPTTSSLNFTTTLTTANLVVVKLGSDGKVSIYNGSSGSVRLIADVSGYYISGTPGLADVFTPLTPARVLDTGAGIGTTQAPVPPGGEVTFQVSGHGGVPAHNASAVILNVTVASATAGGYVTVFTTAGQPHTSNLNFTAGHNVANAVSIRIRDDGDITLYNSSTASVRLIADVSGYYRARASSVGWSPATDLSGSGYFRSLSCPTTTFCAAVASDGRAYTYNGSSWSAGTTVASGVDLTSVSCTSGSFCLAVAGKNAYSYNGSSWSAATAVTADGALTSVSCASAGMCVAVGSIDDGSFVTSGEAFLFNGATWSSTPVTATGFNAVSCASTTFCGAGDDSADGDFFTFDGSEWSAGPAGLGFEGPSALSCTSTTFCAAVEANDGDVLTYDGSTWSSPTTIDTQTGVSGLSCSSSTFCLVTTQDIGASTYNGSTWSTPTTVMAPGVNFNSLVSCPSSTSCVLLANDGYDSTYNGTTWSATHSVAPATGTATQVSCATTTFCLAVTDAGRGLTFDGSTWAAPVSLIPRDALRAVSCPTATFCLALSDSGEAVTFDGSTAGTPMADGLADAPTVSCASATFCVATSGTHSATFNGSTWSALATIPVSISALSCPASNACVAVSGDDVTRFNGTTWSAPVATGLATPGVTSISCSTSTSCVGGGLAFQAQPGDFTSALSQSSTYNGSTWAAATPMDPGGYINSMSCSSTSFCTAVETDGSAVTYDGSHWSDPVLIDPTQFGSSLSVSCPADGMCVVVSTTNDVAYVGQA